MLNMMMVIPMTMITTVWWPLVRHRNAEGASPTLSVLLGANLDPTLPDASGISPLHLVGIHSLDLKLFKQMMDKLFGRGRAAAAARVTAKDGRTVLHCLMSHAHVGEAVARGRGGLNPVDQLLDLGADPYATDKEGRTCLHVATAMGDVDLVLFWVQHDRESRRLVHLRDAKGRTALDIAQEALAADPTGRKMAKCCDLLLKVPAPA